MPQVDVRTLSACIQALQTAIKHNDFLPLSAIVDSDDYEESSYMFELELAKLIKLYQQEEAQGNVNIPLAELLKPPFDGSINA